MTELLHRYFFPLNSPSGMPASSSAGTSLILEQGRRNWEVVCKCSDCLQHSRLRSWPGTLDVLLYGQRLCGGITQSSVELRPPGQLTSTKWPQTLCQAAECPFLAHPWASQEAQTNITLLPLPFSHCCNTCILILVLGLTFIVCNPVQAALVHW